MSIGPDTNPTNADHKEHVRPAKRIYSIATLFSLAAPHRGTLTLGIAALACGSSINLLFPEIVRRLLDPARLEFITANRVVILIGIAGLCMVQGVAFFLRSYFLGVLGQRVYAELRSRLFQAVLDKDISFFDATRASELASRINSDAALIQDAISTKCSVLIRYGIQIVVGVILMVSISSALTVALVLSVLVIVGVSGLFIRHLKTASRSYQSELSRFTSFASECFSGVKIIRALGGEQGLTKTASVYNNATLEAGRTRVGWSASFSSGASALLNILLLLVLSYGIALVAAGSLPMNELAAFVLYGGIVAVSFSFFANAYAEVMQSMGGLERVFELLSTEGEDHTVVHPQRSYTGSFAPQTGTLGRGHEYSSDAAAVGVVFDQVSFAYPNRALDFALKGFSCRIEPGVTTALVGPSGAGKSSVAQLLCGLYTPTSGTISLIVEGQTHPLSELLRPSLKRLISWVPQEPQLFGFSVLENLLLGNPTMMRDEVVKTIRSWGFLDFVDSLDLGIDTILGEHGASLSGGQRQRIAIARALLRKPGLLILDEATSGLDSESEASVMQAIRQYIPEATLLIISHRLATVHRADAIVVIQDGRVAEQGTHASLVQANGLYRQYTEHQSLGGGTTLGRG
jgi:ATP-binding cassette subfamily B protein